VRPRSLVPILILVACTASAADDARERPPSPVVGRWDITVRDPHGEYPSWVEIQETHATLGGRFVGRVGGARAIDHIIFSDGSLAFSLPPQLEQRKDRLVFNGELHGAEMKGMTTNDRGEPVRWRAVRAPRLEKREDLRWGKPIALFNGRDLDGWRARQGKTPPCWSVEDSVLSNAGSCVDLVSRKKFRDFKLHAECRVPKDGDGGIHLRGRYEVRIRDQSGERTASPEEAMGSVYGFLAPSRDASKPAGEWQTMDVTLIGRRLTVELNGETIIADAEIPGITGDALDCNEDQPGPIVLQGHTGGIAFRNLVVTPAR
jgi:hypothetical protein